MKITKEDDGIYCATYRHRNGTLCVGFDKSWHQAAKYCLEMVMEKDKS